MKLSTEHPAPRGPTPVTPELREQINRRAYELFEARRYEHGHDREDWLQAEAEILARTQAEFDSEAPKAPARQAATAA